MKPLAERTAHLRQSEIRAVTLRLARKGGINLGQGICDMPTPEPIKEAARQAITNDRSIYSSYSGIRSLREHLFEKVTTYNRIPAASPDDLVVSGGSTGAFVITMLTLLDPGDEVVLFEPFYGYHRHLLQMFGADIKYVPMRGDAWAVDFDELEHKLSDRTKVVVVTTPGNPNGKVWTREELTKLLEIATRHDLTIVTDEIYEYMLYDGREHVSLASLPGAYERTVTLSGFSKTYNMTGWRLGYAVAPEDLAARMGLMNDLVYICAPTPLQYGVDAAFSMPDSYFTALASEYDRKRTLMCETLEEIGFRVPWPGGAYYVLADFTALGDRPGFEDDGAACTTLVDRAAVGTVRGASFYADPRDGATQLRFCFAKEYPVLEQACTQLREAFG